MLQNFNIVRKLLNEWEKKNLMMYLVWIYKYKIYRKLASMLIKALCIDTCCICEKQDTF